MVATVVAPARVIVVPAKPAPTPHVAVKPYAQAHAEATGRVMPAYPALTMPIATHQPLIVPVAAKTSTSSTTSQPRMETNQGGLLGMLAVPLLLALIGAWLFHISKGVK